MLSLLLGVGAVANAAVIRTSGCNFHMSGAGTQKGPLGELNGGQIRFGDIAQMTFHIDGDKIWDSNGHGCWWTRKFALLSLLVRIVTYLIMGDLSSANS